MPAIAPASSAELLKLIQRSGVLSVDRLSNLPAAEDLPLEASKAASVLVQNRYITRFQAAQFLMGRHKGFRVGPYLIQDLLGRGGMGAVYLADHVELQRKVAIKVLTSGRGNDQKLALERFLREARSAAALDHPNIVRIFDVARHNNSPFLVMEFVEGETLQQTIDRDGCVPFDMAAEYIAQAAAGLQHAHEKGFIHRDIKPGNLIRDHFGVVKILDMGLARSFEDTDRLTEKLDEGAVVGTADFIAPEQAINSPQVDGRADIYSLGATLFTLISGRTPFEGNATQKLMQHQLKEPPRLIDVQSAVPPQLSEVVAVMLEKNPAKRYQNPAAVIEALAPWTGNSARVLAGLSRTKLAQGSTVNLGDRVAVLGSSFRIHEHAASGYSSSRSATFDPTEAGKATTAFSATDTDRSTSPIVSVPIPLGRRTPRSHRAMLLAGAGLGLAVLFAGILIGWLAFGR